MAKKDMNWMRKGVQVQFSPPFGPGGEKGATYTGRLGGEPFLMGNPKNDRWVVRIEDMDENYVKLFGRYVHSCAAVEHVTPIMKGV